MGGTLSSPGSSSVRYHYLQDVRRFVVAVNSEEASELNIYQSQLVLRAFLGFWPGTTAMPLKLPKLLIATLLKLKAMRWMSKKSKLTLSPMHG